MTTEYRDLLPVIVETSGAQMPGGFDSWGIKSVRPDLTTTRNFHWAMPGGVNVSNDRLVAVNGGACPERPGDGLCVATTWRGMASGGIPARTLLLVAYREAEVVGRDELAGKFRIGGEVASVALIDGERLLREHGRCADLRGADLQRANLIGAYLSDAKLQRADLQRAKLIGAHLRGADLQRAKLRGADLCGAGLQYANLQRAKLIGADLIGANLQYANLQRADLIGAHLQGANLQRANLSDADLQGANLQRAKLIGADLSDANLQRADLQGANLIGANLRGADLEGAFWPEGIALPDGWTLTSDGRLTRESTR